MLAQGNQQYQCLKWVPDNSSLPSQLQFRQDFGMFPVMTVPGYFLFVLIRSCMLNEIMLFRDSKMHTSFYLVLFWMIHRVSLWFVSKLNCANFACLQLCKPGCPMEHPKTWCVSPLQQGHYGKIVTWKSDGWGDFVAWQMSEGLSSLFVWWEVGGTLPEVAVHGHWHVFLQVHGLSSGDLFSSQGSNGALQTSGTHLPSTSLPWLVSSSCTRWLVFRDKDQGWVQLQHEGFQGNQALSLRFYLGIKNNGVCAWGNRFVGFQGIYLVPLSAKLFLCLYEEHVTSWNVAVFLIESGTVYK